MNTVVQQVFYLTITTAFYSLLMVKNLSVGIKNLPIVIL
jgi:hypothetical protein